MIPNLESHIYGDHDTIPSQERHPTHPTTHRQRGSMREPLTNNEILDGLRTAQWIIGSQTVSDSQTEEIQAIRALTYAIKVYREGGAD